jgi:hypothetical protein
MFGAALCVVSAPVFAQALKYGTPVKPIAPLPIQETPPQGYFGFKGSQIGTTTLAKSYVVIGQKTVPTLFGQDTWLQIRNNSTGQIGWIYTGSDAKPYQNVIK